MVEKKEGLINQLIYNQTVYNNGENSMFPHIMGITLIIKKLKLIEETCNYLRFNPFYRNAKLNCQIEFDDYMFYIECRDSFTVEEQEAHWTQCMDNIYDVPHEVEQYKDMNEDKKKMARILYPICKYGDFHKFHEYLNNYLEYLDELIPLLFSKAIVNLNLSQEDMSFGYFCFEVDSD